MRNLIIWAFPALLLSACAGVERKPPSSGVYVYKYIGSRQCEGGGLPVEKMMRQLGEGGIPVMNVNCGTDGRMYPAVCGAPDGRIGILEISEGRVAAAEALGFTPLNSLAGASKTVCPKTP